MYISTWEYSHGVCFSIALDKFAPDYVDKEKK